MAGRRRNDSGGAGIGLSMADHDLLITIGTKLDGLRETMNGYHAQSSEQIDKLNTSKADSTALTAVDVEMKQRAADHETRIRVIETWLWKGLGIVGLIASAAGVLGMVQLFHR